MSDDEPVVPECVRRGAAFEWTDRPRQTGTVSGVNEKHVYVLLAGERSSQQWSTRDVARWVRDGLMMFKRNGDTRE